MSEKLDLSKYANLLKEIREDHDKSANSDVNDRILIFDGLNTFIRVFSAVPSLNDEGVHVGGIVGFLKSIGAQIRQFKATRCIIVFDGRGGSARRKKMYPGYKEGRTFKLNVNRVQHMDNLVDEDESMKIQFKRLAQYLSVLPVTMLSIDGVEADDVIGYIATDIYNKENNKVLIVSTDKDFIQLVSPRVQVYSPIIKKYVDDEYIKGKYGVPAHNFLMYRVLTGDNSDNIVGVNGVGQKTIVNKLPLMLSEQHVTVDDMVAYCKTVDKGKVFQTILDSEDVMKLNWKLMSLRDHNFSDSIKLSIHHQVEAPISLINKRLFREMMIQDKITASINNFEYWFSSTFDTLNVYAQSTQK